MHFKKPISINYPAGEVQFNDAVWWIASVFFNMDQKTIGCVVNIYETDASIGRNIIDRKSFVMPITDFSAKMEAQPGSSFDDFMRAAYLTIKDFEDKDTIVSWTQEGGNVFLKPLSDAEFIE